MFQDYNNNRVEGNISSAAAAALATHDYTNRSLASAAEDRCFPCTYQGCVKVLLYIYIYMFKMRYKHFSQKSSEHLLTI